MIENPIYLSIDVLKTGEKIKSLRMERNISIKTVQKILDLSSVQAIYQWENAQTLPSIENFKKLSMLYELSTIDEIIVYN